MADKNQSLRLVLYKKSNQFGTHIREYQNHFITREKRKAAMKANG